jgi:3-deoxy-D-manno-octulosonic acid kinase
MLYDGSAVDQISPSLFEPGHWQSRAEKPVAAVGGRGTVMFVSHEAGDWALRHYRRGGLPGRVLDDQFLFLGENATRSFREFRLLMQLGRMGLPVPRPIAARYQRSGPIYRADLITSRIPAGRPLSQVLVLGQAPAGIWQQVGLLLRRFHDAGVFHADLNAHNILVDDKGLLYLLDFDRGRIRGQGAWKSSNLKRLKRSLQKISRQDTRFTMNDDAWSQLMAAYVK